MNILNRYLSLIILEILHLLQVCYSPNPVMDRHAVFINYYMYKFMVVHLTEQRLFVCLDKNYYVCMFNQISPQYFHSNQSQRTVIVSVDADGKRTYMYSCPCVSDSDLPLIGSNVTRIHRDRCGSLSYTGSNILKLNSTS